MSEKLNRRDFVLKALAVGAALPVTAGILAGCGGGETKPAAESTAAAPAPAPAATGCTDTSSLAPADKAMRESLKYADKSANPEQICGGCQLFVAAAAGQTCGSCNLVKGPINKEGYCTSWVKKA